MTIFITLLVNGLLVSSLYLLVGLGFSLLFFTRKFFDLSYGVLIPIGGYSALVLHDWMHAPTLIAVGGAIVITSSLALGIGKFVFDPLQTKRVSSLGMLVVSLGVMSVLQSVLALIFTSRFQVLRGFVSGSIHPFMYASALAVFVLFCLFLNKTSFGKALRAIRDDKEVAKTIGINTRRITDIATVLAGAIVGLVGVLVGIDTGLNPTMGLDILIKGVTAALLGGLQGGIGVLVGALSLGGLEQVTVWKLPGAWKEAVVFAVLLGVLKVRSKPLFLTA